MVEGNGLENRHTGNRIVSSNLTLTAHSGSSLYLVMDKLRAILIPGNGGGSPHDNCFPYVERELTKLGITVTNVQFPDAVLAREMYWIPFLEKLGADENTILIGHSSGAIAAMRFAETHKILSSVLVGTYDTDLGDEGEKQSGYFDRPWNWDIIRSNQQWVIQFASTDDSFIPIEHARIVRDNLKTDYHEYTNQGHFGHGNKPKLEFSELVEALQEKI